MIQLNLIYIPPYMSRRMIPVKILPERMPRRRAEKKSWWCRKVQMPQSEI